MKIIFEEKRMVIEGASDNDRNKIENFFNSFYKKTESVSYSIAVHDEYGSGMTFSRTADFRLVTENKTRKVKSLVIEM